MAPKTTHVYLSHDALIRSFEATLRYVAHGDFATGMRTMPTNQQLGTFATGQRKRGRR